MRVVDITEAKWIIIKHPAPEKLDLLLLESAFIYFHLYIVVISSLSAEIYAVLSDYAKP
jgi:hypothetical protein